MIIKQSWDELWPAMLLSLQGELVRACEYPVTLVVLFLSAYYQSGLVYTPVLLISLHVVLFGLKGSRKVDPLLEYGQLPAFWVTKMEGYFWNVIKTPTKQGIVVGDTTCFFL